MVVGKPIAQTVRERQDPLSNRQTAEYAVDEVSGQLAHAAATARRANASFAREGHEDLSRTAVTAKTGKAARHLAAGEKLSQLVFHGQRSDLQKYSELLDI